jgi:hypothetical protein
VYVKHFGNPDLFGLTSVPALTHGGTFVIVSSHLDQSPSFARGSLAQTVAHELFHVVQFAYAPDGKLPPLGRRGYRHRAGAARDPEGAGPGQPPVFRPVARAAVAGFSTRASPVITATAAPGGGRSSPRRGRTCWPSTSRRSVGSTPRIHAVGTGLAPLDLLLRHGDGPLSSVFFRFAVISTAPGCSPAWPTSSTRCAGTPCAAGTRSARRACTTFPSSCLPARARCGSGSTRGSAPSCGWP